MYCVIMIIMIFRPQVFSVPKKEGMGTEKGWGWKKGGDGKKGGFGKNGGERKKVGDKQTWEQIHRLAGFHFQLFGRG